MDIAGGKLNSRRRSVGNVFVILFAIAGFLGLVALNLQYANHTPGGIDFIPRWLGARLFLIEAQSPYSASTTRQIEQSIKENQIPTEQDDALFVYPFYSILLFAPFSVIKDFITARALWMTFLECSLILVVIFSLNLTRWRLSPLMLGSVLLFSTLWYHSIFPIINGNVSAAIALFITLAFVTIRVEQDALAGFFLAFATIKPQMMVLLIPFVLIWAFSHRRWTLINSTIANMAILIFIGYLLEPAWIMDNLRQVVAFAESSSPATPGAIWAQWLPGVGSQMGWVLTVFIAGMLLWEWRAAWTKDFQWFFWTACLTLTATNLIGVQTSTANYIALLPVVFLVFSVWDLRWGRLGQWLIVLSGLLLFAGLWWLYFTTSQAGNPLIENPAMYFPAPLFLLIGLYWVKYWALHSPTPLLDQLRRRL